MFIAIEVWMTFGSKNTDMDSTASQRAKRATFMQPRRLTKSEVASLKLDARSTSTTMKHLINQRSAPGKRQTS
jgi:hypothetical protein